MTTRWNPKPSLCFERSGYGTLMVIGPEVYQFDEKYRMSFHTTCSTFLVATQTVMAMIGVSNVESESTSERESPAISSEAETADSISESITE